MSSLCFYSLKKNIYIFLKVSDVQQVLGLHSIKTGIMAMLMLCFFVANSFLSCRCTCRRCHGLFSY